MILPQPIRRWGGGRDFVCFSYSGGLQSFQYIISHSDFTMPSPSSNLSIKDLQQHIRRMYYDKDVARGVDGTFMWLMEEVGELASALRGNDKENLQEEFADVIAWLFTIANVADVNLAEALTAKYGQGCPGCHRLECECSLDEKP